MTDHIASAHRAVERAMEEFEADPNVSDDLKKARLYLQRAAARLEIQAADNKSEAAPSEEPRRFGNPIPRKEGK